MMKKHTLLRYALRLKPYVLNKYTLTCIGFAFVLTFCGEHRLYRRAERARQIRAMETELQQLKDAAAQAKEDIRAIQGKPEELERFARERYYMHADNEQVWVIE